MSNVLLVGLNYSPEHAGIAPYTTGLARGLAAAGHRVDVLAGFPYYPHWRPAPGYRGWRAGLRKEYAEHGVRVTRLRHHIPRSSTGLGRVLHEASFAAHAAARGHGGRFAGADVVLGVSPSLLSLLAARRIAAHTGAAFGVVVQDLYAGSATEIGALGGRAGGAIGTLESAALRAADGIVVVHEQFRETLREKHGIAGDRIRVIRNWAHVRPAAATADPPWPPQRTVALHAGNMGAKQDLSNVVEAARLADADAAPVHFALLGDGARRAEIEALAGGIDRISVLPPVPDDAFCALLATADVLLVNEKPGMRTVAVPSKLTSYFAAGRPVIAASEPSSPASAELSAAGAGLRVPPGEPRSLLDAVLELGRSRDLAETFGASGRQYARQVLGEQAALERYRDWVNELREIRSGRSLRCGSPATEPAGPPAPPR